MSTNVNTSVHDRTISAFFDTKGAADKAIDDLVAEGLPRQHISLTGGERSPGTETDKGLWESLKDMFLPDEDRYTYSEGLRRGGYLVAVRADEANYDRVLDILDNDGSVNMDERERQWKSEGWTGYAAGPDLVGSDLATMPTSGLTAAPTTVRTDTAARAAALGTDARALATGAAQAGQDEVIPVYEEQLRVGKRDVNHGRVRLRSYVVETPVNEQVSLRNEKVIVDRKPVDRAVTTGDALFKDRVIELEEHAEEAVISKEARVKEEITVRKTAEDRVQAVSDTVRRTEVEIDDNRNIQPGAATRFSAQADSNRIVEHMDVISSDGQKVGTVDHLDGPDRIKLAKNTSPDGQHHYVPLTWIDHIDQHVHLNKALADVKAGY